MITFQRRSAAKCHPGRQLGNYRLVRWLGEGGYAEVYLGKHIYLGTLAAVKILRAGLADVDAQAFFDEARIAARLVHPHIVRVLEFGVERRVPFLVMDYAPKGTLRRHYLPGSRLVPKVVLKYMQQAANAVQYIHDQGLVHRDIKPENLLLGHHNELWLSDFGIAVAAHKAIEGECVGAGTIAYMAPEQIEGKPCLESDQYALGIVVYEWLYGTTPFVGSVSEIAYQHFYVAPQSLRTSVPIVPWTAEDVVFKALAKDPQQRFESVQAFAEALRDAFEPQPMVIRGVSRPLYPALASTPGNAPATAAVKPEHEKSNNKSEKRIIRKEIAACFAIELFVGVALGCVLYGLGVTSLLLKLLLALCMALLPLACALIRKNRPLFLLSWSIVVAPAAPVLLLHSFILFVAAYIGSLLLGLLTACAIIVNDV
jgi:serine/threonine protein kinase